MFKQIVNGIYLFIIFIVLLLLGYLFFPGKIPDSAFGTISLLLLFFSFIAEGLFNFDPAATGEDD